ncbi:NTP transferase domain-containing protein [Planctomycetales bacterium ZRK34]|nr:NTP transferase domain-containing protein [Planctomycetales bacterium ZRK34]
MRYAVIIAGGAGTRLWPMSRSEQPKQLIPFLNGRSLLQVAVERLRGVIEPERVLICTGEQFRGAIRSAMPQISDDQIIGEPEGRDTLAAVALPAAVVARQDPDATIAVFTADHLIEPVDVFTERVQRGYEIAEQRPQTLVTFGIEPTHAATGYGYVRLGEAIEGFEHASKTLEFKEKPDEATAEQYVADGSYLWNSGMFVWRAQTLLDCVARYEPSVHEGVVKIAEAWGTPQRGQVVAEIYPTLKKISVDFAVMENAAKDEAVDIATVKMPVKWLDVGGWPAYGQTVDADHTGNRAASDGVLVEQGSDNLVVNDSHDHVIALLGVSDLIVVHTKGATLICHRDAAESIKALHAKVREIFGDEYV